MKSIFKLHAECGRQGTLYGLFIAENQQVEKLIESEIKVYFGEVLGKHSEIFGSLSDEDIEFITDDQSVVEMVEINNLCVGFDPFKMGVVDFDYESIGLESENENGYETTVKDIIEKMLSDEKNN